MVVEVGMEERPASRGGGTSRRSADKMMGKLDD